MLASLGITVGHAGGTGQPEGLSGMSRLAPEGVGGLDRTLTGFFGNVMLIKGLAMGSINGRLINFFPSILMIDGDESDDDDEDALHVNYSLFSFLFFFLLIKLITACFLIQSLLKKLFVLYSNNLCS